MCGVEVHMLVLMWCGSVHDDICHVRCGSAHDGISYVRCGSAHDDFSYVREKLSVAWGLDPILVFTAARKSRVVPAQNFAIVKLYSRCSKKLFALLGYLL
ncbi:Uncharacterized protein TCM_043631 [Theobroma cacao]|uniref:Uncharacterized protein n=1 Tax=Theobroma cacao TaxID=3641 RepID=A0A061FNW1_THECC|nr:Uncharacterized protein TCM_043631 [Theobroma cacao]